MTTNEPILIKDALLITQNEESEIIPGNILIVDGKIAALGDGVDSDVANVINACGKPVLPAFINAHLHLGETIFRGRGDQKRLSEYLELSHNSYLNSKWASQEKLIHSLSAKITLIESVRHGVGTVAVSRGWQDVRDIGLNGFCGYPVIKISKLREFYDAFEAGESLPWVVDNCRIRTALFIQSLLNIDRETLLRVREKMIEKPNWLLFIHVAETQEEIQWTMRNLGGTPFQVLERYGLLGPRCICVHCVHLEEGDLDLVCESGAKVVCCPTANLKLGSGIPPLDLFVEKGLRPALATDGLATNNSASLLEAAKIGGLISEDQSLSAQDLLDMITCNAAYVLGVEDTKGSLEQGKDADLAIFDVFASSISPKTCAPSNLIYNSAGIRCNTLIVGGRLILREGQLLTVPEDAIVDDFNALCERLMLGLPE